GIGAVLACARALEAGRLGRADVEAAIRLSGVGGNDRRADALGDLDGECRLAARRGADDADDPRACHRWKSASSWGRLSAVATGRPWGQCATTSTPSIETRRARTWASSSRCPTRTTL